MTDNTPDDRATREVLDQTADAIVALANDHAPEVRANVRELLDVPEIRAAVAERLKPNTKEGSS